MATGGPGEGAEVKAGAEHLRKLCRDILAAQGSIGMAMTNTEPGVTPFGGIDPVLGANPVSCAVPAPGAWGAG